MRGPGVYVGPGRVFSAPLSTWRRRRSDRRRGKKKHLNQPFIPPSRSCHRWGGERIRGNGEERDVGRSQR